MKCWIIQNTWLTGWNIRYRILVCFGGRRKNWILKRKYRFRGFRCRATRSHAEQGMIRILNSLNCQLEPGETLSSFPSSWCYNQQHQRNRKVAGGVFDVGDFKFLNPKSKFDRNWRKKDKWWITSRRKLRISKPRSYDNQKRTKEHTKPTTK